MSRKHVAIFLGTLLLGIGMLAAQGTPPATPQGTAPADTPSTVHPPSRPVPGLVGSAELTLTTPGPTGTTVTLDACIDLTKTRVILEGNVQKPCVLGAYVLGLRFDPKTTRLVDIQGGTTAEFNGKPIFTNLEKANKEGLVKFTAVQTGAQSPTGLVSVAKIQLEITSAEDLKKLELYGDSLASTIYGVKDGKPIGPYSIPSNTCPATVVK